MLNFTTNQIFLNHTIMLRLFIPVIFIVLFIVWFLYRLFVKKDIKQQLNTVYLGLFFIGIWAVMYWWLLK